MLIDFDHLSVTVSEIYACVGTPNGFRSALHRIRTVFGASRVALVTRLTDRDCFYYDDRCAADGAPDTASLLRDALNKEASAFPVALRTGKICSNCLAGQHANRLCCCVDDGKSDPALPSIHLSLHREAGSLPFGESERRALESLAPHVLRAVRLSNRIDLAETACNMGNHVLDEVRRGVVVLNSRKEAVFMNRRAEAICSTARGVTATRQPSGYRTLKATCATEDVVLQRAVDRSLGPDSTTRRCLPSVDAVRISASHSGSAMLIRVAQLPPASGGQCRILLFIDDLAVKELGDDRLLTALFGLTKAEVRIASALLAGKRPKDIATRFSVSEDTVRTQLKAVYAKTETRGLAPLIALLTRLADVPVGSIWDAAMEPKSPIPVDARPTHRAAIRFASVR